MIKKRLVNAVLSRQEWQAVAPAIKAESRRKKARWTLLDVAGYDPDTVCISLSVYGPYFHDLDELFSAHVPGWENMEV